MNKLFYDSGLEKLIARGNSYEFSIRWFLLSLILVFAFIVLIKSQNRNYFDDAYMFVRYADNILQGLGHSWNAGESSVYGSTSVFYTLQLVLIRSFDFFTSTESVVLLSSIWAFAAVLLLADICSRFLKLAHIEKCFFWLLLALSFTSPFVYHANTGMDTTNAFFSHVLLIWLAFYNVQNPQKPCAIYLLAVASFFAIFIRPDSGLVAVAFPVLVCWFYLQSPWRAILKFSVTVAVLVFADLLLKTIFLHSPLPLAFYAKQHNFYEGYMGHFLWNPVVYLLIITVSLLAYIGFYRHYHMLKKLPLFFVFLLPPLLTYCYYFSVVQVMGHLARYYFPFVPYFIVYCLISFAAFQRNKAIISSAQIALPIVFTGVTSIAMAMFLPNWYEKSFLQSHAISPKSTFTTKASKPLKEIDRWSVIVSLADFAKQMPKGGKFALSEYGYIGSEANHVIIVDMLGLHDQEQAYNGFDVNTILSKQPDIIWLAHSHYTKINTSFIDSLAFQKNYDFYPEAFLYGFAINRNAKNYTAYKKNFEALFEKVYQVSSGDYIAQWPITGH